MFSHNMLLVCPSCNTRYVVPDTAIGVAGRQVRCANCRHSWFQEGPTLSVPPAPKIVAPAENARTETAAAGNDDRVSVGEAAAPVHENMAPPPVYGGNDDTERPIPGFAASYDDSVQPASHRPTPAPAAYYEDEGPSRFAHEPPFRARRNPARLWTMAAIGFAVIIGGGGLALSYFGPSGIGLPDRLFSSAGREPDLQIVLNDNLELNERADGTPFFIASGTIVNPTAESQPVPPMLITLKDASGRSVYSWTMKAKASELAPGARVDFSEARLDVPLAAAKITASWVLE